MSLILTKTGKKNQQISYKAYPVGNKTHLKLALVIFLKGLLYIIPRLCIVFLICWILLELALKKTTKFAFI